MKKFENPEVEIEELKVADVITASGETCDFHDPNCDSEL